MAASIALPGVQLLFHVKHDACCRINGLVAGGRAPSAAWLQRAMAGLPVYCADRGAQYCLSAGIAPQLLLGDCDSAPAVVYERAADTGAELALYSPAKDDTDLQLLLQRLPAGDLLASGIWGGRFDHLFSNVYSLLAYKERQRCQVIMADERELMLLLTDGESVELELEHKEKAEALSLLPLSGCCRVSIDGVRWPLQEANLCQQHPYAVSNEPVGVVKCSCSSGKTGLYVRWRA